MRKLVFLIFSIVNISCKAQSSINRANNFHNAGFVSQDIIKKKFIFSRGQFSYVLLGNLNSCCDTLSKGDYNINYSKKLIYLSSSGPINSSRVSVLVTERKAKKNNDSILFLIKNPIQSFYSYDKRIGSLFEYQINLFLSGKSGKYVENILPKKFDDTLISIKIDSLAKIDSFTFRIWPKYSKIKLDNIHFSEIQTKDYKVLDDFSTEFEINIPELTFQYLNYMRFKNEIIEIVDTNTLKWNGVTYIRESKN